MDDTFIVVVSLIIEQDGNILFVKRRASKDHAPNEWEFVSGRVEHGEMPEQAVLREAKEETGLDVKIIELIDTFHFLRGAEKAQAIGITYHCQTGSNKIALSSEHSDFCWLAIIENPAFDLQPGILESLETFRLKH